MPAVRNRWNSPRSSRVNIDRAACGEPSVGEIAFATGYTHSKASRRQAEHSGRNSLHLILLRLQLKQPSRDLKWPRRRLDFGGGSLSEGSNEATGEEELGEPSDDALDGKLVPRGILDVLKLGFPGHGPILEPMQHQRSRLKLMSFVATGLC